MPDIAFLSTYPPTRCGLATFTRELARALAASGGRHAVIRVRDAGAAGDGPPDPAVACDLVAGDGASRLRAIAVINEFDVVIVQHEYGIYGGPDGDEVLAILAGIEVPSIVVLHTVLESPTVGQRAVLERIGELATLLVVMSDSARETLRERYDVPAAKVTVIPHGVPERMPSRRRNTPGHRVLTWGLLGPGKGIEHGIEAVARLADLVPPVEYLVVGATHPKVLAREGEAYRHRLQRRARDLGVERSVHFLDRYLDAARLADLVGSADVVLLPYDSEQQSTSGVLVEALSAGRPVVATRFPHATELLSDGAGIVVDHDPDAIAWALRTILEHPDVAQQMSIRASLVGREMGWSAVAGAYRRLAESLVAVSS
jgi:glycosyltransferase involved in cell wall biosynthesis